MRFERQSCDHTEAAATTTLESPEQFRVRAGIGDEHFAIRGDDLRFEKAACRRSVVFGEAAKAAALDEPRNANGRASPALDVAAALRHHGLVDVHPDAASADADRRARGDAADAADADKGVVQLDGIHAPRPNEERIRRVRITEVAVTAALDHQPQPVLAREVHGRSDICRTLGRDRIGARLRRPGIGPAERLRESGMITNEVRILQVAEELSARSIRSFADAGFERRLNSNEITLETASQSIPCRRRRPVGISGPHAAEVLTSSARLCLTAAHAARNR